MTMMREIVPAPVSEGQTPSAQNSGENSDRLRPAVPPQLERNQFRPGQSGNPGGRPKGAPVSEALREMLDAPHPDQKKFPGMTGAQALASTLFELAINDGDMRAAQEIADRVEGKVLQGLQHSGPGGGAISLTSMTPEENERRIAELLAKCGGTDDREG